MDNRNRSNVLLVELLIAIFFFMIAATVVLQVFAAARNMTARSAAESRALAQAQNVADALIAAEQPERALEAMAFRAAHGIWTRAYGDYALYVEGSDVPQEAGTLWQGTVRAYYSLHTEDQARQADEELFALPCARYREAEP